jgi:DNA-binding NarL/FixJ family response regulator
MKQGRILIVEDDPFVQMTLAKALESANFEIVARVATATEAIHIAKSEQIDVAILDLDLGPGATGIDVAHALRKNNRNVGLVLLTSYTDPRISDPNSRALPIGTIFLTKSRLTQIQELITAILQAKVWPLDSKRSAMPERSHLTQVQIDVLRLLAEGATTSEIALQQGVSQKAVEATITRLHNLLGLSKNNKLNPRVQLVRAYFALSGKKPPGA